jgi:hypothetical protein
LDLTRDGAKGGSQVKFKDLSNRELSARALAFPEAAEELAKRFWADKLTQKAGR